MLVELEVANGRFLRDRIGQVNDDGYKDTKMNPWQERNNTNNKVTGWIGNVRTSLAFLSRLPLATCGPQRPLSEAMAGFGPAGAVIGAIAGCIAWASLAAGLPASMAAIIGVGALVAISGALHEDGLADTADGLGGWTRERALEIMRDSRIGAYGVLALVLVTALRIAAYDSLILAHGGFLDMVFIFSGTACLSRAALPYLLHAASPARTDGQAAGAGRPDHQTVRSAIISGLAIYGLFLWSAAGFFAALAGAACAGLAVYCVLRLARTRLGGMTGDVAGAAQQIGEVFILSGLIIAG